MKWLPMKTVPKDGSHVLLRTLDHEIDLAVWGPDETGKDNWLFPDTDTAILNYGYNGWLPLYGGDNPFYGPPSQMRENENSLDTTP